MRMLPLYMYVHNFRKKEWAKAITNILQREGILKIFVNILVFTLND